MARVKTKSLIDRKERLEQTLKTRMAYLAGKGIESPRADNDTLVRKIQAEIRAVNRRLRRIDEDAKRAEAVKKQKAEKAAAPKTKEAGKAAKGEKAEKGKKASEAGKDKKPKPEKKPAPAQAQEGGKPPKPAQPAVTAETQSKTES